MIELGPITLAWHGITIAVGIVIGGFAAARHARELGLDTERLRPPGCCSSSSASWALASST